jgi:hypothetical protein
MREPETFAAPVQRVEIESRLFDGTVLRWDHVYDSDGRLTGYVDSIAAIPPTVFHFEGVDFPVPMTERQQTEHDGEGRLRRVEFFAPNGRMHCTLEIERDARGRCTRAVQWVDEQAVVELRKSHDDERRIITSSLEMHGMPAVTTRRQLDARGLTIAEETVPLDGEVRRSRMEYVLNDRGDWIEQTVFADGYDGPVSRTVRRITYRT